MNTMRVGNSLMASTALEGKKVKGPRVYGVAPPDRDVLASKDENENHRFSKT